MPRQWKRSNPPYFKPAYHENVIKRSCIIIAFSLENTVLIDIQIEYSECSSHEECHKSHSYRRLQLPDTWRQWQQGFIQVRKEPRHTLQSSAWWWQKLRAWTPSRWSTSEGGPRVGDESLHQIGKLPCRFWDHCSLTEHSALCSTAQQIRKISGRIFYLSIYLSNSIWA